MFHYFQQDISHISLPEAFTYPFCYTPHPLCVFAANQLQEYLAGQLQWLDELQKGKMFGVLIVRNNADEIGFLTAFSGNIDGKNNHPFFVPPVFDMLQPNDFFKQGEAEINAINNRIDQLTSSDVYLTLTDKIANKKMLAAQLLSTSKEKLKAEKDLRDWKRQHTDDPLQLETLLRESQHSKAEFKRLERHLKADLQQTQFEIDGIQAEIDALKRKRKTQSAALQQQIFDSFKMLNIRGEERGLCTIFESTALKTPPAGSGECAAPKLLQYAFKQKLFPLAIAEFWWGDSPKSEIRHHGRFYPSCKGKCEPILTHMLKGMNVEPNPLADKKDVFEQIHILYEDPYLLIVNKPHGLLSVPGKASSDSLLSRLKHQRSGSDSLWPVHRLDMNTSGLLILAKSLAIYKQLQAMFLNHSIFKRYVAWLDGVPINSRGIVDLPLIPDYLHRPMQKVDSVHGKPAITHWKTDRVEGNRTRVYFYPFTGRTHQLRVHAAHPQGLACPIVGDPLYGRGANRMLLHAELLRFRHPVTGNVILCQQDAGF